MSENVNDKLDTCTNSRQELRRNCSPIGHNNTKHFCAQSGASIRLTVWKWSGESRYPRSLPPVLENFRRAFSPGPTDCPWVSEDVLADGSRQIKWSLTQRRQNHSSLPHDRNCNMWISQPWIFSWTATVYKKPRMKIPVRQDGHSLYLAQPYRILNWETELKNLFT